MVISCLGIIIAGLGNFIALGVYIGETAYIAFDNTFLIFIVLFFITIAVFGQDFSKDKQNQPEAESDSSLS